MCVTHRTLFSWGVSKTQMSGRFSHTHLTGTRPYHVLYTVARGPGGVRRHWGITATSCAPGAAHLGHHRTQGQPQVRLSHTESGYMVPQVGVGPRSGRLYRNGRAERSGTAMWHKEYKGATERCIYLTAQHTFSTAPYTHSTPQTFIRAGWLLGRKGSRCRGEYPSFLVW